MAISDAMRSASIRLAGQGLTTFFEATGILEMELCDLIDEVAMDICIYQDWQRLVKVHDLAGDGATEAFNLPSDYSRQLLVSDMQDLQSWAWGYEHVTDINDFLYQKNRGAILSPGMWIIYGNQFNFAPAPTGPATFPYVSRNYAYDSATLTYKPSFTQDTDEFVLTADNKANERLLTLGLVWKWREMKKLDFSGDQEAFALALNQYGSKDGGSNVIKWGGGERRGPWPWVRA